MFDEQGLQRYYAFIRRVDEYRAQYPHQRLGQAMYNVLAEFDADAERIVHGTPLDPFYKHGYEIGEFKAWLRARWGCL